MRSTSGRVVAGVLLAVALTGCGSAPGKAEPSGVDLLEIPTPSPKPSDFVAEVDNSYFPLKPGSEWSYESVDESRTVTVVVSGQGPKIQGVATTEVRRTVANAHGRDLEESVAWYAQDRDGNVWFFGEQVTRSGRDILMQTHSWLAGESGAQAGLVMPAKPRVGDGYQEEYAPGIAEDLAHVLSIDGQQQLPAGEYDGLLVTENSSPLEGSGTTLEYYAPGIGLVLVQAATESESLQLVDGPVTRG